MTSTFHSLPSIIRMPSSEASRAACTERGERGRPVVRRRATRWRLELVSSMVRSHAWLLVQVADNR